MLFLICFVETQSRKTLCCCRFVSAVEIIKLEGVIKIKIIDNNKNNNNNNNNDNTDNNSKSKAIYVSTNPILRTLFKRY